MLANIIACFFDCHNKLSKRSNLSIEFNHWFLVQLEVDMELTKKPRDFLIVQLHSVGKSICLRSLKNHLNHLDLIASGVNKTARYQLVIYFRQLVLDL